MFGDFKAKIPRFLFFPALLFNFLNPLLWLFMVVLNSAREVFWKVSAGAKLARRMQVTNACSRPLLSCSLYISWAAHLRVLLFSVLLFMQ